MKTTHITIVEESEDDVYAAEEFNLTSGGMTVYFGSGSGGYMVTPDELYAALRFKERVAREMQAG